ncbi:hypothetical protein BCE_2130 [Bacillus cereus ATCC 10987]|uniref:Uncharacterized protein n=1 Tax=Bacillus cereus (strain ATCC 10987 / NRS 248) TaxID=222523 RepID=Q739L0_BACC1|nr:hypothetical protein BCE_2130 [Bacillus cereus ATCC 10987]
MNIQKILILILAFFGVSYNIFFLKKFSIVVDRIE